MNDQERRHDHESDPAHTPGDGWVSEGGASHLGPATHTDPEHERHAHGDADESEGDADDAE